MEQSCGHLAVELVPLNTAISVHIMPRDREFSLENAQRCSFLIMEKRSGPLSVEMVPEKHCNFITSLAKRTRAQSGACAEVKFPVYRTEL
jgi:hypothetical protein